MHMYGLQQLPRMERAARPPWLNADPSGEICQMHMYPATVEQNVHNKVRGVLISRAALYYIMTPEKCPYYVCGGALVSERPYHRGSTACTNDRCTIQRTALEEVTQRLAVNYAYFQLA